MVTSDGESWGLPGGRPEGDEDWRVTLDREVFEEACVRVEDAKLLGFSRGRVHKRPRRGPGTHQVVVASHGLRGTLGPSS